MESKTKSKKGSKPLVKPNKTWDRGDHPYCHINKYIDIMKNSIGKRIEIIVVGDGCSAHFICNSWDHCLRTVASFYSQKEGAF